MEPEIRRGREQPHPKKCEQERLVLNKIQKKVSNNDKSFRSEESRKAFKKCLKFARFQ